MSKESLTHIEDPRRIIFRETFNDEQSVRRNGGVPTGVTFSNGIATFGGNNDWIDVNRIDLHFPWTARAIIKPAAFGSYFQIMGAGSSIAPMYWQYTAGVYGSFFLKDGVYNRNLVLTNALSTEKFNDVIIVAGDGGNVAKLYIDGDFIDSATYAGYTQEYITRIGARADGAVDYNGDIDLIEVYNYALTAEEAANLSSNRRHTDIGMHREQLGQELVSNWDSVSGWIVTGEGAGDGIEEVATGLRIVDTAGAGDMSMQYDAVLPANTRYKMVLTVTGSSMFLYPQYPHIPVITSPGTYTYYYTDPSLAYFRIDPEPETDAIITNLSIKEVLVEGISETLNVSAQSGSIIDRWGNALTLTNMDVVKDGDVRAMLFDGADSKVDCGYPDDLTGDISIIAWIKPYDWGEGSSGRGYIISNGGVAFGIFGLTATWLFHRAGAEASRPGTIKLNQWQMVVVVSPSNGENTIIYKNGVAEGAAFDGVDPIVGTTNIIIGNNDGQSRTFDGLIGEETRIIQGLLTTAEISQLFSNERSKYRI